jgi:hypothetical protein
MYFDIFRPRRRELESTPMRDGRHVAPRDIGRHGHPRDVFMTRPPSPRRYGRAVRWQTSGYRATRAPHTYFDVFDPAAESSNRTTPMRDGRRDAPRDIGRHGHPRGVFMTIPPSPRRYGRVVRWQTSGGRAKCAPRMYYFDVFKPRRGELESQSTPSDAAWLPETSAGTATHAAYL